MSVAGYTAAAWRMCTHKNDHDRFGLFLYARSSNATGRYASVFSHKLSVRHTLRWNDNIFAGNFLLNLSSVLIHICEQNDWTTLNCFGARFAAVVRRTIMRLAVEEVRVRRTQTGKQRSNIITIFSLWYRRYNINFRNICIAMESISCDFSNQPPECTVEKYMKKKISLYSASCVCRTVTEFARLRDLVSGVHDKSTATTT